MLTFDAFGVWSGLSPPQRLLVLRLATAKLSVCVAPSTRLLPCLVLESSDIEFCSSYCSKLTFYLMFMFRLSPASRSKLKYNIFRYQLVTLSEAVISTQHCYRELHPARFVTSLITISHGKRVSESTRMRNESESRQLEPQILFTCKVYSNEIMCRIHKSINQAPYS